MGAYFRGGRLLERGHLFKEIQYFIFWIAAYLEDNAIHPLNNLGWVEAATAGADTAAWR